MPKSIQQKIYSFEGKDITVRFRKIHKAKGIRIHISSGQAVGVTGNPRTSFRSLEQFFLLHREWVQKKLCHFQESPNPTIKLSPKLYREKKEQARTLVYERLSFWNQYYQYHWSRVTIRNQSTRWGSCSSARTLSFHAGIIDLPRVLQDYLIVHELCHLQAMNHGAQFWNLVERALPDARMLDTQLKKYSSRTVI